MAGHIIYVHTTIQAPPDQVWDVVTDVGTADRILRSVSSSELLTEGRYGVGTRWREKRTLFGHHGEEELHVVECEAPHRTVVETRLGHDVVRTAFRITGAGARAEHTRLAMTTTLVTKDRSPVAKLAWAAFGGFSYDHTHKMLEHDLEDIEAEVLRRSSVSV